MNLQDLIDLDNPISWSLIEQAEAKSFINNYERFIVVRPENNLYNYVKEFRDRLDLVDLNEFTKERLWILIFLFTPFDKLPQLAGYPGKRVNKIIQYRLQLGK